MLRNGFAVSGSCSTNPNVRIHPSFDCLNPCKFPVLGSGVCGKGHLKGFGLLKLKSSSKLFVKAQATICVSKAQRWWEKTLKPNMMEINSSQELVDSLRNAGDRLVIVGFYSPGCGGCRSLHPKLCQLAEANPGALFLQVNHENLQPLCHALHVHVLPFFRFYRGAEGHVCSFSCTIATIKKFKDALAKYDAIERHGPGLAKGLDDSELMKLDGIGEISVKLKPVPSFIVEGKENIEELAAVGFEIAKDTVMDLTVVEEAKQEVADALLVA
ncbi:Thioredoxin-like 1-2, chloroplastic-like protein [Drosera capensis]